MLTSNYKNFNGNDYREVSISGDRGKLANYKGICMQGKCYNQLEWQQLGWRARMSFPVQMYGGYAKYLNLDFSDLTYKKFEGGGYVQLLSTKAGDEKLLWYPQNGEGVRTYIVGEPEEPDGFSVPVNVVMTKVH